MATKRQMVNRIAVEVGLPKTKTAKVVELFLQELGQDLVKEGRAELRGFGVWEVVSRPAHTGKHPQTGEAMEVEAVRYVSFKAGSDLRRLLNEEGGG